MGKNVTIVIESVNDYGDNKDSNISSHDGCYSVVNGKTYYSYEDDCKNMIVLDDNNVKLSRKSERYRSVMDFCDGKKTAATYNLEGLSMAMEIDTKSLTVICEETDVNIRINYIVIMDGSKVSDNTVDIKITSKI